MKSKREYTDYLRDILDAVEKALQFIVNMDYETFRNNDKTQFAVTRALTIIGEAAKKIPKSVQNHHPEVPWKQMAGMHDIVTHDGRPGLAIVWDQRRDGIEGPSLSSELLTWFCEAQDNLAFFGHRCGQ